MKQMIKLLNAHSLAMEKSLRVLPQVLVICEKTHLWCRLQHCMGTLHTHWKNWKTWKNERSFSSQGKVREFRISLESQGIFYQSEKSQGKLDQKIILLFYGESLKTVVSRHSFV